MPPIALRLTVIAIHLVCYTTILLKHLVCYTTILLKLGKRARYAPARICSTSLCERKLPCGKHESMGEASRGRTSKPLSPVPSPLVTSEERKSGGELFHVPCPSPFVMGEASRAGMSYFCPLSSVPPRLLWVRQAERGRAIPVPWLLPPSPFVMSDASRAGTS